MNFHNLLILSTLLNGTLYVERRNYVSKCSILIDYDWTLAQCPWKPMTLEGNSYCAINISEKAQRTLRFKIRFEDREGYEVFTSKWIQIINEESPDGRYQQGPPGVFTLILVYVSLLFIIVYLFESIQMLYHKFKNVLYKQRKYSKCEETAHKIIE